MNPIVLITLTGETTYQQYINQFVLDNHSEILGICTKVTENSVYEADELLSELVLFLQGKQDKILKLVQIDGKSDKGLMRYIAQWCYNQIRLYSANGGSSNFKGKHQPKSDESHLLPQHDIEDVIIDDSHKNIFDDVVKHHLSTTERALYDIHIIQGKNVREIKKMIPALGKFPLYKMIRELKDKIKAECELRLKEAA